MILSDSEEILVLLGGVVIIMAIIANVMKDYRRMSREANRKIAQQERDEAYVKELKRVIDKKNEELQKIIKEQQKQ